MPLATRIYTLAPRQLLLVFIDLRMRVLLLHTRFLRVQHAPLYLVLVGVDDLRAGLRV